MNFKKTKKYSKTKQKLTKNNQRLLDLINETEQVFKEDQNIEKLSLKNIKCKRDKNRMSIRVLNTQYRIILTLLNSEGYVFLAVLTHDDYDRLNKDC